MFCPRATDIKEWVWMRCMLTTRPHDQVNGVTAHKACRCFGQRAYHWQIERLVPRGVVVPACRSALADNVELRDVRE